MTIDQWITTGASRHPDKTAIEFNGEPLSYQGFATAIDVMVSELRYKGVSHGDRVAWYGFNAPKVFVLLFACARIGAIFVPLNWRLAGEEIAHIVSKCEPAVIYWDDAFADKAQALPTIDASFGADHPSSLGDPMLIVYTSGSTGRPKGAVLAQEALVANAEMSVEAHGLTPDDTVLNALPLFHVGGLNILPTPAFSIGASVILHQVFDPVAMVKDLGRVEAAITVPTVLGAVMSVPDWQSSVFPTLRCMSIGSTDVPMDMVRAVHARGIPVLQIYGATETSPCAIYQTHVDAMATEGSLGRKGNCEIRLVQSDGQDAPTGEPGEIWVRGKNTLLEYWRDPDQTAEAMEDGWFKTGDVAWCDGSGQYFFADRIKHIIISGGENIYPTEIERVLRAHPALSELSVVGIPDPKWGETPVVVAVRTGEVDGAEVLAMLNGALARYKHPRRVVFVDQLPRNAMGKIVVDQVRELAAQNTCDVM